MREVIDSRKKRQTERHTQTNEHTQTNGKAHTKQMNIQRQETQRETIVRDRKKHRGTGK